MVSNMSDIPWINGYTFDMKFLFADNALNAHSMPQNVFITCLTDTITNDNYKNNFHYS